MDTYSYGIDFFSDETLERAISSLLDRVRIARENVNPYKNTIDPFAGVFEAASLEISMEEWFPTEITRQINKSLTNAVGDFHQELMGHLPGWKSTGKAGGNVDLEHPGAFGVDGKPAFAEVKNKYNTMNSKTQEAVYDNFQNILGWPQYRDYNCYLIQVIQKRPSGDVTWWPAKRAERQDIRRIGAQEVYEIATGNPNALSDLFKATVALLEHQYGLDSAPTQRTFLQDLYRRAFPEPIRAGLGWVDSN